MCFEKLDTKGFQSVDIVTFHCRLHIGWAAQLAWDTSQTPSGEQLKYKCEISQLSGNYAIVSCHYKADKERQVLTFFLYIFAFLNRVCLANNEELRVSDIRLELLGQAVCPVFTLLYIKNKE